MNDGVWPNFFIVGAARSATTTFHEVLSNIPDVYMSPYKEPEFFSSYPERAYKQERDYLKLFEGASNALAIGESSAIYLMDPKSPNMIFQRLPHSRIIAILRNPIDRAFSHYLLDRYRLNVIDIPFEKAIQLELERLQYNDFKVDYSFHLFYLQHGFYSSNLEKYCSLFGAKQVKILFFEEFIKEPEVYFNSILQFLGIPHLLDKEGIESRNSYKKSRGKISSAVLSRVHNNKILKGVYSLLPPASHPHIRQIYSKFEDLLISNDSTKPEIPPETKRLLQATYADEIAKIERIIGRRPPWKDF